MVNLILILFLFINFEGTSNASPLQLKALAFFKLVEENYLFPLSNKMELYGQVSNEETAFDLLAIIIIYCIFIRDKNTFSYRLTNAYALKNEHFNCILDEIVSTEEDYKEDVLNRQFHTTTTLKESFLINGFYFTLMFVNSKNTLKLVDRIREFLPKILYNLQLFAHIPVNAFFGSNKCDDQTVSQIIFQNYLLGNVSQIIFQNYLLGNDWKSLEIYDGSESDLKYWLKESSFDKLELSFLEKIIDRLVNCDFDGLYQEIKAWSHLLKDLIVFDIVRKMILENGLFYTISLYYKDVSVQRVIVGMNTTLFRLFPNLQDPLVRFIHSLTFLAQLPLCAEKLGQLFLQIRMNSFHINWNDAIQMIQNLNKAERYSLGAWQKNLLGYTNQLARFCHNSPCIVESLKEMRYDLRKNALNKLGQMIVKTIDENQVDSFQNMLRKEYMKKNFLTTPLVLYLNQRIYIGSQQTSHTLEDLFYYNGIFFSMARFSESPVIMEIARYVKKWAFKLKPANVDLYSNFIYSLNWLSELSNIEIIANALLSSYLGKPVKQQHIRTMMNLDYDDGEIISEWQRRLRGFSNELGGPELDSHLVKKALEELCVYRSSLPYFRLARILLKGVKENFDQSYLTKLLREETRRDNILREELLNRHVRYRKTQRNTLGELLFRKGVFYTFANVYDNLLIKKTFLMFRRHATKYYTTPECEKIFSFLNSLKRLVYFGGKIEEIGPILLNAHLGKKITPAMVFRFIIETSEEERLRMRPWQSLLLGYVNELTFSTRDFSILKNSLRELQFDNESFVLAKLILNAFRKNVSKRDFIALLNLKSLINARFKYYLEKKQLNRGGTLGEVLIRYGFVLFFVEFSEEPLCDQIFCAIKLITKQQYSSQLRKKLLKFIKCLPNLKHLSRKFIINSLAGLFFDAYLGNEYALEDRLNLVLALRPIERSVLDTWEKCLVGFKNELADGDVLDRPTILKALKELNNTTILDHRIKDIFN
jgi:hypothetical protein